MSSLTCHRCSIDIEYQGEPDECVVLTLCPLHAAASELLAALTGLLELGRKDTSNPKYDGYYEMAKAAIAKAEARSE